MYFGENTKLPKKELKLINNRLFPANYISFCGTGSHTKKMLSGSFEIVEHFCLMSDLSNSL